MYVDFLRYKLYEFVWIVVVEKPGVWVDCGCGKPHIYVYVVGGFFVVADGKTYNSKSILHEVGGVFYVADGTPHQHHRRKIHGRLTCKILLGIIFVKLVIYM